jgi:hypothetical protein
MHLRSDKEKTLRVRGRKIQESKMELEMTQAIEKQLKERLIKRKCTSKSRFECAISLDVVQSKKSRLANLPRFIRNEM